MKDTRHTISILLFILLGASLSSQISLNPDRHHVVQPSATTSVRNQRQQPSSKNISLPFTKRNSEDWEDQAEIDPVGVASSSAPASSFISSSRSSSPSGSSFPLNNMRSRGGGGGIGTGTSYEKKVDEEVEEELYVDPMTTLSCHRREYTFKASRTDSFGRKCWQYITAMSCWGRCDSGEISDWRFPYKKSYHPICGYEKKRTRRIRLKHCDEGVENSLRIYTLVDALSCSCKVCHNSQASCDGLIDTIHASREMKK